MPVAQRTLREMEQDRVVRESVYDSNDSIVAEAAAPSARSGAKAVENAQSLDHSNAA